MLPARIIEGIYDVESILYQKQEIQFSKDIIDTNDINEGESTVNLLFNLHHLSYIAVMMLGIEHSLYDM